MAAGIKRIYYNPHLGFFGTFFSNYVEKSFKKFKLAVEIKRID
jgi:hypothetical protein